MEEYKKIHKIQYYDVDRDNYIKTNRLFEIMTAVATEHSGVHEIDAKRLMEKGMSWIVYDINLDFSDDGNLYGKDITVKSFVKNVKGMYALRYFTFYDEGNLIGKGVAKWFLFDIGKRKIVRLPKDIISAFTSDDEATEKQKNIIDTIKPIKQRCENNIEDKSIEVKNIEIRYNDIDENGHVNNSVYPLWAAESISRDTLKSHKVYSTQITYKKEQIECDNGVKVVCKESKFEDHISEHIEIYSYDEELLCIVDMCLKPME